MVAHRTTAPPAIEAVSGESTAPAVTQLDASAQHHLWHLNVSPLARAAARTWPESTALISGCCLHRATTIIAAIQVLQAVDDQR